MDLLDLLLGRDDKGGKGVFNALGGFARWIVGCGCILALLLAGAIVAILGGLIHLSDDQVTIVIVFITMIVAVVSLIRTSLGY